MKLSRKARKAVLKENEPGDMSGHPASDTIQMEMQPDGEVPWVLSATAVNSESQKVNREPIHD